MDIQAVPHLNSTKCAAGSHFQENSLVDIEERPFHYKIMRGHKKRDFFAGLSGNEKNLEKEKKENKQKYHLHTYSSLNYI